MVTGAPTLSEWIDGMGKWGLGLVLLIVGFGLFIRAVMDLWSSLGKENKEWGKAGIGVVVGAIGGLMMVWGVSGIMGFFQGTGSSIPHG